MPFLYKAIERLDSCNLPEHSMKFLNECAFQLFEEILRKIHVDAVIMGHGCMRNILPPIKAAEELGDAVA